MTEDPSEKPERSSGDNEVSLENKKNVSLILLVAAWFIPFLWPFAIAGTIAMFPRTSKKIGYGLLGLIAFGIVAATINGLQQSAQKPSIEPKSTEAEDANQASPSPMTAGQREAKDSSPTTGETNSGRRYLGTSPTGYELWADNDCVYVKGITEGDLARLGTDVWDFKKAVKAETGYSCVLYE